MTNSQIRNLLKISPILLLVLSIGIATPIGLGYGQEDTKKPDKVPTWFKGTAGFWAEGKISTNEFVDGIEFLLSQKIIEVPSTATQTKLEPRQALTLQEKQYKIEELQDLLEEKEQQLQELKQKGKPNTSSKKGGETILESYPTGSLITQISHIKNNVEDNSQALRLLNELENIISENSKSANIEISDSSTGSDQKSIRKEPRFKPGKGLDEANNIVKELKNTITNSESLRQVEILDLTVEDFRQFADKVGRNPQTGKEIHIQSKFKSGNDLSDSVNLTISELKNYMSNNPKALRLVAELENELAVITAKQGKVKDVFPSGSVEVKSSDNVNNADSTITRSKDYNSSISNMAGIVDTLKNEMSDNPKALMMIEQLEEKIAAKAIDFNSSRSNKGSITVPERELDDLKQVISLIATDLENSESSDGNAIATDLNIKLKELEEALAKAIDFNSSRSNKGS